MQKFALYFGNRGFFPGEVIAEARREMVQALEESGFGYLIMEESATRYGAVETLAEGKAYAEFLRAHRGEYDGIILCLPNFGDENGAAAALAEADVPILVQAYPDEEGRMDFAHRRDALCGKLAMCNVLRQCGIRYTLTRDFTVHPLSPAFQEDLRLFAGVCRCVKGMRRFSLGAFGARMTAFKTVRTDEIALQNKGINVETIDLSEVFARMEVLPPEAIARQAEQYAALSDFGKWPNEKLYNIARLGAVIDEYIERMDLQAVAVRCWDEIEKKYGVAPCLILGELNERGIAAACELDVNNAVTMRAMYLASGHPVMLLDVNNNTSDPDEAIFFHCGPAPRSMMRGAGHIEEHLMFRKSYGAGSGVGINVGSLLAGKVTVGSVRTENGRVCSFAAEGEFSEKPMPSGFFGCGAYFCKKGLPDMLRYMAQNGYKHHVCIAKGEWAQAVREALENYLGYESEIL